MTSLTISVIGLGYVGLPVAVSFAEHEFNVIGFDISQSRIDELSHGHDQTNEIDAARLQSARLTFTGDKSSLSKADFHIVAVPTPVDTSNLPDLEPLQTAARIVGEILKPKDIVVFESTVYPGCTEEECIPILETASSLKVNKDFGVGYSPERINPGDKARSFDKITKVVSGSNRETLSAISKTYGAVIDAGIFEAASIKVAEAAKVIENTQRDLNIALVNELSEIFEKLDIETADVLEAAKTKWNFLPFEPGLVGGHCIGVDPYYLTFKAQQLGIEPNVILAGRKTNNNVPGRIAEVCIRWAKEHKKDRLNIGLFGLTFKENVPDARNSKVPEIISTLESCGHNVLAVDPYVGAFACHCSEIKTQWQEISKKMKAAIKQNFDIVILAVPHDVFVSQGWQLFDRFLNVEASLIVDVKSTLVKERKPKNSFLWRL